MLAKLPVYNKAYFKGNDDYHDIAAELVCL